MAKNSISEYASFLRGINVGGHKKVPMEKLRATFEALGYAQVRTLLNSGNVIFQAKNAAPASLDRRIARELEEAFGFPIGVITRPVESLRQMVEADPFTGIKVTPETRLYVTFFSETPESKLPLPHETPGKELQILALKDNAIFSVVTISDRRGTVDAMGFLEKTWGREVTTRNWNTIQRIVRAAA